LVPAFDIFKTDKDGHLVWCATAVTLEDAQVRARALAQANQCAYLIFNQKTGKQFTVRPAPPSGGNFDVA
jgi:hypothetical protein